MNDEPKQLIEDAAQLLGATVVAWEGSTPVAARIVGEETHLFGFNPLDPERGDLMKLAEAAELCIDARENEYFVYYDDEWPSEPAWFSYAKGDYQSLALAVLRAASAVLKARGE
jgi:hypothetical protein